MANEPKFTSPELRARFEVVEVARHARIPDAWMIWTRIESGFPHGKMKLTSSNPSREWEVIETGGWQPSTQPSESAFIAITLKNLTDAEKPTAGLKLVEKP